MTLAVRWVAVFCGLALSAAAHAQDYPAKAVRVLVGSAPGGPVDIAARVIGEKLAAAWKQPVTVENRVGASEMIATGLVAQAAPDGYTLLMASLNVVTINPVVFSKIEYDPDALAPVVLTTRNPMVLIAGPKAPFNSVVELIKMSRANSGGIQWSTPGLATSNHIAGEWFAAETGAQLFHVPYKGGPAAAQAVLSGDVPFGVVSLIQALPLAKAGQVKVLAVTTGKRSALVPDWPTIAESAVPGFDAAVQTAFFAPGGTPRAVIARINADVNRLLQLPEVRERCAAMGVEAVGSTPEELDAVVKTGRARIQQIVRRAGIKVQ
jgi:tripartite-type tricarboxylate transporter receptor subunit TctC